MEFIIEDLDARKQELDEYLRLIDFLDTNSLLKGENGEQFEVTSLLKKTMKGSVYLLLYSLVESTMREAVVAIHDDITSSSSPFEHLREELQLKILSRARRDGISISRLLAEENDDISLKLHKATLNRKKLFSGNVDREKIKSVAETYGFSHTTDYLKTGHGEQLTTVKQHRNDLAHGNKTFSGVGGGASAEELRIFSEKVISYIYEISDNIIDSLDNKLYLKT
jgi:hypothetical protein